MAEEENKGLLERALEIIGRFNDVVEQADQVTDDALLVSNAIDIESLPPHVQEAVSRLVVGAVKLDDAIDVIGVGVKQISEAIERLQERRGRLAQWVENFETWRQERKAAREARRAARQ